MVDTTLTIPTFPRAFFTLLNYLLIIPLLTCPTAGGALRTIKRINESCLGGGKYN